MAVTEPARIANQLRRAFDGDTWSGPSLTQTLNGLTAAQAAAYPLAGVHSVGELVRHLTTWVATVTRRIETRNPTAMAGADWPPYPATTDAAGWQLALRELRQAHHQLLAATENLPAADLDTVFGSPHEQANAVGVSVYVLLHGTVQHYLYHAGQIALLRKFI